MKNKLVLFDIDWTLVRGGGSLFIEAHRVGLRKTWGVVLEDDFDITPHEGKVGKQFIRDLAVERGVNQKVADESAYDAITATGDFLKENADRWKIEPLPGARECLEQLQEAGITLGLLTGNSKTIAEIKLAKAGLWEFFSVGAYGDETFNRTELVDIAKKRAEELLGKQLSKENIYLVGDSWRDIVCGQEGGIKTIAVASGPNSIEELLDRRPDLMLESLLQSAKLLIFIEGEPSSYESRT